MAYRRGFKTEAEQIAAEIRGELGLSRLDALDPWTLADHLDIPVVSLSEMAQTNSAILHLVHNEPGVLSAITVFDGPSRMIVHNDGHAAPRQRSNVAHELSHGLLMHPATPAVDDRGCRHWNQDIEDEATWLAGCLLVTDEAAIQVARGIWTLAAGCHTLGVSEDMLKWRMRMTGAIKRVERARKRWGR